MRFASRLAGPLAVLSASLCGQTTVWTGHYDNFRTGANTQETILTPANVNASHFGRLTSLPVSGCVAAQPLYVLSVPVPRGPRNLLILATTTNMVYGYDADDFSLHFARNFGVPFPSTIVAPDEGYYDVLDCDFGANYGGAGPIGIVGTPVIDVPNNTMYFVANTMDGPAESPRYHHFVHKLSLTNGADLVAPVEIAGSYAGVPFQTRYQLQRTALLLLNGRIYIAFASHHDEKPYYGWLFAYDTNLNQVGVMNYSPAKSGTGIWQSGGGPATDGRYLYFTTGNNAEDNAVATDNSESILKVDPISLQVIARTSFYPEGNNWDEDIDIDLGSSRVIVLPGANRLISGSKYGDMFVVNQDGMNVEVRQQVAARHSAGLDWTGIYNGFAFWNNTIYAWPGGVGLMYGPNPPFPTDTLKAFAVNSDYSAVKPIANGESDGTGVGYQGASIVISANGQDPSTGILWAYTPTLSSLILQPGFLHAYNASDFSNGIFHELWNNNSPGSPDQACLFAKFTQPLIANGKVFLPTFSGRVIVYGLLNTPSPSRVEPQPRLPPERRQAAPGCPAGAAQAY
jgi:hypothetical protein